MPSLSERARDDIARYRSILSEKFIFTIGVRENRNKIIRLLNGALIDSESDLAGDEKLIEAYKAAKVFLQIGIFKKTSSLSIILQRTLRDIENGRVTYNKVEELGFLQENVSLKEEIIELKKILKKIINEKDRVINIKNEEIIMKEKEIHEIRKNNPGIKIIAHPECPPDVIKASDFAGSTSGMIKYVEDHQPKKVMMVTECSMSDNIQVENPNVDFIKPCNMCPYMKKITLPKILDCLENETGEIIMDKETIDKARISVEKMAAIGR